MRGIYQNQERFQNTYFQKFPGFYVTGDGKCCSRDLTHTRSADTVTTQKKQQRHIFINSMFYYTVAINQQLCHY